MKKILLLLSLFLILPQVSFAQVAPAFDLPQPFVKAGTTNGVGTHFTITDSLYLNTTLDSSEQIKLKMESAPEMVTLTIESSATSTVTSTQITLSGFIASTTYYKYEDSYHNLTQFISDADGMYSYTQDLSKSHIIFIQPRHSTKFIKDDATGGDCASIGIWDNTSKVCTMNTDLTETIQIDSDSVTLDGNGHTLTGYDTGNGIFLNGRTWVKIRNLNIQSFYNGIYVNSSNHNNLASTTVVSSSGYGIIFAGSNNNTIASSTVSSVNGSDGILVEWSNDNTLTGNTVLNIISGITLLEANNNTVTGNTVTALTGAYGIGVFIFHNSNNNIVTGNTISNDSIGIYINGSGGNTLTGNTVSNNFTYGLYPFMPTFANKIYHNNFINNSTQVYISTHNTIADTFNLASPIGGNHWSDFDTASEGCSDANNDGFCDAPYVFNGGQDNLPWTQKDGWLAPPELPLNVKAAELAKLVIDADYLGDGSTYGGKGWDSNQSYYVPVNDIFDGYNYYDNRVGIKDVVFGAGLDCSGLVEWAYNRSYNPYKSVYKNAVRYPGADAEYHLNSSVIPESDLQSGDLLFFGITANGVTTANHVAIYVGDFSVNGQQFDMVEAMSPQLNVRPSLKSVREVSPKFLGTSGFRRLVVAPSVNGLVKAGSPIDISVTDPDGYTITATTTIQTDEEYLREIPGQLYYSESELGPDGTPEDVIYWPTQKIGNYVIKVTPDVMATATSTYSLTFQTGDTTILLAQNVPISQIPAQGYGVETSPTGVVTSFIPALVDIKPGSSINSINLNSNGVIPVAIFGSATFDVHKIDVTTIRLANASVKLKGNGQSMATYSDINGDGFTDVVVQVLTQALQLSTGDVQASLVGQLIDGLIIKGSDLIRIVP